MNSILDAVNVALNKEAKFCGTIKLSNLLFDGNTVYSEMMLDKCSVFALLVLDLVEMHTIQYVVVYSGVGWQLFLRHYWLILL